MHEPSFRAKGFSIRLMKPVILMHEPNVLLHTRTNHRKPLSTKHTVCPQTISKAGMREDVTPSLIKPLTERCIFIQRRHGG